MPEKREDLRAATSWRSSLLRGGRTCVSLSGDLLRVQRRSRVLRDVSVGRLKRTSLKTGILGKRLRLETQDGETWSTSGLRSGEARELHNQIEALRKFHLQRAHEQEQQSRQKRERAEAERLLRVRRQATELEHDLELKWKQASDLRASLFSGERYVRHSRTVATREQILAVVDDINDLLKKGSQEVLQKLRKDWKIEIELLERGTSGTTFDTDRRETNKTYVANRIRQIGPRLSDVLHQDLTNEQLEAIATDEDATLVLAGAGSGKTSVIVAKVVDLVMNNRVPPEAILVLAFNTKARDEIRDRLCQLQIHLAEVNVHTFHSYGMHTIATYEERKPTVSAIASDPNRFYKALDSWIDELLNDPERARIVMDFMLYYRLEYRSPFDFDNDSEYFDYIRTMELRTLLADKVKSFEELTIANWLAENGVTYEYEVEYPYDTRTAEHSQYRPDFWLCDYDIYIEHFALDERDISCFGQEYEAGVRWKREIHRRNATTLLETYSWQHGNGTLLDSLRASLDAEGVEFNPVPRNELLSMLKSQTDSNLSQWLETFLGHVKTNNLSMEELRNRANDQGDVRRTHRFLDLFEEVHRRYDAYLADEGKIDFHYLIDRATVLLRTGLVTSPYRYVLVDEFQDISRGRMQLIRAHRAPNVAFFLVGDDWQAINRFAGGDIDLMLNCEDSLGMVQRVDLRNTFRYSNAIGLPTQQFIEKNPAQSRRDVNARPAVPDEGIIIYLANDTADAFETIIEKILRTATIGHVKVMYLGRYNHCKDRLSSHISRGSRSSEVYFSTVHRAKGREADHVVLVDANDGRWGFPSQVQDDPLMTLVLPKMSGEYPHAEERRLFYVALTRARSTVHIIAKRTNPSLFVLELLECPSVRQVGDVAHRCPGCERGFLEPSKSGKNLRCTNFSRPPKCAFRVPKCGSCDRGFCIPAGGFVFCTNEECDSPNDLCPRCGDGVMTYDRSEYGPWEYCSRKFAELPCRFKRNSVRS